MSLRSISIMLFVAVSCAAVSACGSSDQDGQSKPPATYAIGANKTDRLVSARLRRAVRGARMADPPIQLDMRRIAPFGWTRMYVFTFEDRRDIQQSIEKHSGFRWDEAPDQAGIEGPGTSILVFASKRRVLSVIRDAGVAFDCLDTVEGWSRNDSRFVVLRTAGDRKGVPAGVNATRPEPVALPASESQTGNEPCIRSLGVLH
jgi:hypothetical protein